MGSSDQLVEVLKGAKLLVHIDIIGNIVAKVDIRRLVNGREPDGINAKIRKVIQFPGDPFQVANAITVEVHK